MSGEVPKLPHDTYLESGFTRIFFKKMPITTGTTFSDSCLTRSGWKVKLFPTRLTILYGYQNNELSRMKFLVASVASIEEWLYSFLKLGSKDLLDVVP